MLFLANFLPPATEKRGNMVITYMAIWNFKKTASLKNAFLPLQLHNFSYLMLVT